ncbi:hypothetical protein D3874_25140 [Oleomonas cavernae]|uniref:Uncharacterized protein n=1 Tax=Oleomonas cavernae TaxID=2320859 RepID=A0A418VZJ4_9PROT|nr:hypothetical protein D3874_25140 [Oleomonas cavernae]
MTGGICHRNASSQCCIATCRRACCHHLGVFKAASILHSTGLFGGVICAKGRPVTQRILLGSAFYLLWVGLSGHFSPFLLATSVLSVVGVVALVSHLGLISRDFQPFTLIAGIVGYWGWLLVEILKANFDVIVAILRGRISPAMAWLPASQKSQVFRALYANSITLTPVR